MIKNEQLYTENDIKLFKNDTKCIESEEQMNEEEKKAVDIFNGVIEYFKKWNKDVTVIPDDKHYYKTVLNLIEKQKRQLKQKENRERNLSRECQKYFDLSIDLYSNIVNIKEILDKVEMSDYNSTVNALVDIRRILNEE